MKPAVLFGVLVAFAVGLFGQAPPKDVDGWGKIKWGMTVAQAKSEYGDQAQSSDDEGSVDAKYVQKLVIKSFAVGDVRMRVSIETRPNSDLVKQVGLMMAGPSDTASAGFAYNYLKGSLTQKYGPPAIQGKDTEPVIWSFPSTVIRLSISEYWGVFLDYTATDQKARDAL